MRGRERERSCRQEKEERGGGGRIRGEEGK